MKKEIMITMCVVVMATRNGVMAEPAYDGVVRDAGDGSQVAYMQPPYKSNHASTLEKLPGGGLIAAWFSGEREEASGCAIVVSRLEAGSMKWTAPITVSKREGYSNQNPVLYYSSETKLTHLYHSQAEAKSGESKAQIYHLQSSDNGKTWSSPDPWLTNPGSFPGTASSCRQTGKG